MKEKHIIQSEYFGRIITLLYLNKYITSKDLEPIIKKGTSNMLNEKENKIFKRLKDD